MDLNYLLYRHQVSLMRAEAASCAPSRLVHEALAEHYAGAVSENQRRSGGSLSLGWIGPARLKRCAK